MEVESDLPLFTEDLYDHPWINDNAVELSTIDEYGCRLQAAKDIIHQQDAVEFIRAYALMFLMYIRNKTTNDPAWFEPTVYLVIESLQKIKQEISELSEHEESWVNTKEAFDLRNSLRIMIFILCRLLLARMRLQQHHTDAIAFLMSKKSQQPKKDDHEELMMASFTALRNAVDENISDLWPNDPVDTNILTILVAPYFSEFERGTLGNRKAFHDVFIDLLEILAIDLDYDIEITKKLTMSLGSEECCPLTIAECIRTIHPETGSFLDTYLARVLLISTQLTKRTAAPFFKNFQIFMNDIAHTMPKDTLRCMNIISRFLKSENYVARVTVLNAMSTNIENYTSKFRSDSIVADCEDGFLKTFLKFIDDPCMYVRSQSLQICKRLALSKSIPISRQLQFTQAAVHCVKDQSMLVRRHALGAILALATNNDFTSQFDNAMWKEQLASKLKMMNSKTDGDKVGDKEECNSEIEKEIIEETVVSDDTEDIECNDRSEQASYEEEVLSDSTKDAECDNEIEQAANENVASNSIENESNNDIEKDEDEIVLSDNTDVDESNDEPTSDEEDSLSDKIEEIDKQNDHLERLINDDVYSLKYIKSTVKLVNMITSTIPYTTVMLHSKLQSDVICAIDFLVKCFCDLGMEEARTTVDNNLHLVWHPEKTVRDAIVNAFVNLHLDSKAPNGDQSVQKLMSSLEHTDKCGFLSIEIILNDLFERKMLNDDISKRILDIIDDPGTSAKSKINAFIIINLLNRQRVKWIKDNIETIVERGLKGHSDMQLMGECYRLISSTGYSKNNPISNFIPINNIIFTRGAETIINTFCDENLQDWKFVVEQFLITVTCLSDDPIPLMEKLTKNFIIMMTGEAEEKEEKDDIAKDVPTNQLLKFCFFLGNVGSCIMSYSEGRFVEDFKLMQIEDAELEGEEMAKDSLFTSNPQGGESFEQFNDDAAELKRESQRYLNECAFQSPSMLTSAIDFIKNNIIATCSFEDDSQQALIYEAYLSLIRIVMISESLLEQHLEEFFNLLDNELVSEMLKSSLIMIFGDLAMRYPNTMEPWNPRIYQLIRNSSVCVRISALRSISRLVLREMIKVRGQISEVAVCVVDSNRSVRSLSRYFFEELAKRSAGASIYNVFPDVLSRLSDLEHGVDHNKVKSILYFLSQFITKDKQRENLVVKLCHRMRLSTDPKQWADFAFCLTLVVQSDRTMKRLNDFFPTYGDKIHDEVVYKYFKQLILAKRRSGKQINRGIVDEFEQQVEAVRSHGLEDAEGNPLNASILIGDISARKRQTKTIVKRGAKRIRICDPRPKKRTKRKTKSSSSSDSSTDSIPTVPLRPKRKRKSGDTLPAMTTRGAARAVDLSTTDEADSEEH